MVRHAFGEQSEAFLAPLHALGETRDAGIGGTGAQLSFGFVQGAQRLFERFGPCPFGRVHVYLSTRLRRGALSWDSTPSSDLPTALRHLHADLFRLHRRA